MEFDFAYAFEDAMSAPTLYKRIGVFGSTGSIGKQTLDVIRANPNLFSATILTAQSNAELLIEQALEFKPLAVVI
jgi:1-deoxy-D-xylulose-5-phosphate reductoisomerase